MTVTFGIDVGVDGAVAIFVGDRFIDVVDLPTIAGAIGKKARRILNPLALSEVFSRQRWPNIEVTLHACVERIHAMPLNGAIATFSQGHSLGTLMTVLALLNIPCRQIGPKDWKKAAGLPANSDRDKKQDKEVARALAIQLYPAAAPQLALKKSHNRADAILIGRYAVKTT